MTLPKDEDAFEKACAARYEAAEYYTQHMETNVPGFPDQLNGKETYCFFVEYKYLKKKDINAPMVKLFQETQPSQLMNMVSRGVIVKIAVYFEGRVYFGRLCVEGVKNILSMTANKWLSKYCKMVSYCEYLDAICREM